MADVTKSTTESTNQLGTSPKPETGFGSYPILLQVITIVVAAAIILIGSCMLVYILWAMGSEFWGAVLSEQFPMVVGLPCAAATSFVVVIILRQTEGPVKFEGLSFKFEGASGQVVLWLLTFLVVSNAIHTVWDQSQKLPMPKMHLSSEAPKSTDAPK